MSDGRGVRVFVNPGKRRYHKVGDLKPGEVATSLESGYSYLCINKGDLPESMVLDLSNGVLYRQALVAEIVCAKPVQVKTITIEGE